MILYLDSLSDNPEVFFVYLAAHGRDPTGLASTSFVTAGAANDVAMTRRPPGPALKTARAMDQGRRCASSVSAGRSPSVNPWSLRNGLAGRGNRRLRGHGCDYSRRQPHPHSYGPCRSARHEHERIAWIGKEYVFLFLFCDSRKFVRLFTHPIPPCGFKVATFASNPLARSSKYCPGGRAYHVSTRMVYQPGVKPFDLVIRFVYDDVFEFFI